MLVSFDFDGTLAVPNSPAWRPNRRAIARLRMHARKGDEVVIVTRRGKGAELLVELTGAPTVEDWIYIHRLPVARVFFTDGKLKGDLLSRLGIDLHYDDDIEEIETARVFGVDAMLVPVLTD